MTLKKALFAGQELPEAGPVLIGTTGGFVLRGTIEAGDRANEGSAADDAQVIHFKLAGGGAWAVEKANGSTIAIPTGRLIIPIASIAWMSHGPVRPSSP